MKPVAPGAPPVSLTRRVFRFVRPALAAAALGCAGPALAAPAWITLPEDALAVLQRMVPQAAVLGRADVAVALPEGRRSAALRLARETVVAVEVDDQWLEILSLMVHSELQRCGGYVFHDSQAAALAALHRLSTQAIEPLAVGPAPSYAIDNQKQVAALLPLLQSSHLLATVDSLAAFQNRRHNSSHGVAAAAWLASHWRSLVPATRADVRVTEITHPSWAQKSVMLEITGTTRASETVVLGGHLDSIAPGTMEGSRAPGADDKASGIAALTEVIRVMMAGRYRPARTLRFIGYAAEEVGLRGSGGIAADFLLRSEQVVGVLQLDMTAFQGDSTDIWLYTDYTNAAQNTFLANLVTKYMPGHTVGYSACGYACSDHASWHNRGFRASFPHEASNANYNRQIHTVNDTTATFGNNPQHMLKFAKLALAYAVELGSLRSGGALGGR